ncbi:hypothetical protein EV189_3527 [Motilibacter rhizosphaerae]|uniref:Uncharacterized protein n=1 Tax=Motilibacter rhizosphaerae TaxID=598652 RepID=A0A4Q7NBQ3_9ACTN|nr:hypothetical protein [Motilibacter rhizosphaerae]RZS80047.1 hypothetical protein EV189_3527 [Motilibacter rhizosphaerae]
MPGPLPPPGPDRGRLLVRWLLEREAVAGSTWMPAPVALSALAALDVADPAAALRAALEQDDAALVDDGVLALPEVALAEEEAAEQVERLLVTEGRLRVVVDPAGDAHRLGLVDAAATLEQVDDGGELDLRGDPAALPAGPGQVLRDLVASGAVEVEQVELPLASALDRLRAGVRRGALPPPAELADDARSVVVVPVSSDEEAAHRTGQLVAVSVPRAFGSAPDVVTLRRRTARALDEQLGVPVRTVGELAGARSEALVLVLPPSAAGSATRELLVTALAVPRVHVSLVTGLGAELPRAVAARAARPRRTRLAALLREG